MAAEVWTRSTDTQLLAALAPCLAQHIEQAAYAPNLRAAVEYALLGGGKRVRPLLVLRCAEAASADPATALDAAAAIEMVHAFSLVHDDLPALDNDDLRRGRPTLHVAFGEALAILAGDALLALAVQAAASSARGATAMTVELARATNAMITGQVLDTLGGFDAATTAEDRVRRIHLAKTGALINCACRMGALAAHASDADFAAIDEYGEAVGLMFQIVDDIIDETQSAEHAGKAVGKDRQAGKLTYPGVFGLPRARAEVERLRTTAAEAIVPLGARGASLAEFASLLSERTR